MPTFRQSPAPYQRKQKSTLQIMIELTIGLGVIWLAAVVYSFLKLGVKYGINSIGLMLTSVAVTACCDVLVTVLKNKKDKELLKKIPNDLLHSYSWVTAMIFTLCCPVWTSYYVIAVGSIFATLIGKHVFGGFGKNIFNPAAIGRIFVLLCFNSPAPAELYEHMADTTSGATVTNVINSSQQWLGAESLAIKPLDLLAGHYFGAMGETFTVLLLVVGVVLAIRRDIQWRAPVFYLGTVAISSLVIGLVLGFANVPLYMIFHLATGGLMFGAVFMITDPVTTPTSPFGNCLVGVIAGLMVVLMRIGTKSAEGVVYSLVLINLLTPMIDALVKGKTSARLGVKYGVTFGTAAVAVALCVGMAWGQNGGREVNDVNGIVKSKYDKICSTLNFSFLNEGDTYAPYSKDLSTASLPEGSSLYEHDGLDKAYSVLDANGQEYAVVYCIKSKVVIHGYEWSESTTNPVVYIAFNTTSKDILGYTFVKPAATAMTFNNMATGKLDANIMDGTIYTVVVNVPANEAEAEANPYCGATFSAAGLVTIFTMAHDLVISQYGA